MEIMGEIYALLAAVCWMITAIAFEIAGKEVGTNTVNILKLIFAFIFMGFILYFTGNRVMLTNIPFDSWKFLSISGFIGFVLGDFFLINAFVMLGSRVSLLIMSSAPIISAILGFFVFNEVLSVYSIIGMTLTLIGITMVLLVKDKKEKKIKLSHPVKGIVYASLGALGQAVGLIFSKLGMADLNIFEATQIRILAGVIGLTLIFTFRNDWYKLKKAFTNKKVFLSILIGALFGLALGVVFSLLAIKNTSVGIASTIMAIAPVLIIPISIKVFKEKVDFKAILGAFIAIAGVTVLMIF